MDALKARGKTYRPTRPPLLVQIREKYDVILRLEEEFRTTKDSRMLTNIMRALPQRRDELNRLVMQALPVVFAALDAINKPERPE